MNDGENEEFGFSSNYFLAKELRGSGKKSHLKLWLELVAAAAQIEPKHEKEAKDVMNSYKSSCGLGLLMYGFGSKTALLEDFASTSLTKYSVVVVNGYLQGTNIKQVVVALAELLWDQLKTKRSPSRSSSKAQQPFNSRSMDDLLAFLDGSEETTNECIVCVVIHNIDGPGLRDSETQQCLARVASCSHIRIVASIDHVNAPLLWDKKMVHTEFNWYWHHVPTFAPYKVEGMLIPLILAHGNTTQSAKGATIVLQSLTSNAQSVFKVLAEYQLSHSNEEGMPIDNLYATCRERFLVSSQLTLNSHLTEFKDHELVKTKRNSDGQDCFHIPLTNEALEKLLADLFGLLGAAEEMWGFGGRCYWGRKARQSDGVEGIVVLFAWMSSQERQLKSFVELYSSLGWNSLVCHSQFLNMFFPEKATTIATDILNELVEELKIKPCPVVFASFSGGPKACMLKVLQIIEGTCEAKLNLDDCRLVKDCISGHIFDSCPVDFTSDLGAKFVLHPSVLKISKPPRFASWMVQSIASGLDALFLNRFESQRAEYWQTLYSTIGMQAPYLILCSENDDLAPYQVIYNFSQRLRELGADVKLVKWNGSPHVGHYKHYPVDYKAAITELLGKATRVYSQRIRRLEGETIGMQATQDEIVDNEPMSSLTKAAGGSNGFRGVTLASSDHFFTPGSMEYEGGRDIGSMQDERKEGIIHLPNTPTPSMNAHGVLGQILFDVCVPKTVEDWDIKSSSEDDMPPLIQSSAYLSYEESRRQRMEENKKRMEALNLPMLAQSLKKNPNSPKPSPMKRAKARTVEKQLVEVRRSSRVANLPTPVYKEVKVVVDREMRPRRYSTNRHRDLSNRVYASDEARDDATARAEALESGLGSSYPTMVKPMLQSHVTGGFWLGLPKYFCSKNLPKRDDIVTLIDEDEDECEVIYLAEKRGLSGGWRGFAIDHGLVDGDALVFQLIRPKTLKVKQSSAIIFLNVLRCPFKTCMKNPRNEQI
ncbi:unnamed protein product [Malus baccata var. baccata]